MLSLSLMLRGTFHITLSCLFASSQLIVIEPSTLPPVAGMSPVAGVFFLKKPLMLSHHYLTNIFSIASIRTAHFCLKSATAAPTLERAVWTEFGDAVS